MTDTQPDMPLPTLFDAIAAGDLEAVEALITAGHPLDGCMDDPSGDGVLHMAAVMGDTKMTGLLLKHGADPMQQNAFGQRPHDIAVLLRHENVEIVLRAKLPAFVPPFKPVAPAFDAAVPLNDLRAQSQSRMASLLADMTAAHGADALLKYLAARARAGDHPNPNDLLSPGCDGRSTAQHVTDAGRLVDLFSPDIWRNALPKFERLWSAMPSPLCAAAQVDYDMLQNRLNAEKLKSLSRPRFRR